MLKRCSPPVADAADGVLLLPCSAPSVCSESPRSAMSWVDDASPFRPPPSHAFTDAQAYLRGPSRRTSMPAPSGYGTSSLYAPASTSEPTWYASDPYAAYEPDPTPFAHRPSLSRMRSSPLPPIASFDAPPYNALQSQWTSSRSPYLSPASSATPSPVSYTSAAPDPYPYTMVNDSLYDPVVSTSPLPVTMSMAGLSLSSPTAGSSEASTSGARAGSESLFASPASAIRSKVKVRPVHALR